MAPRFTLSSRALGAAVIPLTVVAVIISVSLAVGQETGDDATETPAPVGEVELSSREFAASQHIAVVGDALLTGSNIAPLSNGPCGRSDHAPVEIAALRRPVGLVVENHACQSADFTDLVLRQIPDIREDTELVIVGGGSLEFDWPALQAACLVKETRTAPDCDRVADEQQASAANAFFQWQSIVRQIARQAPNARVVVVGSPNPVSAVPLLLGSACCDEQYDGHRRVRAVFNTAAAGRRAGIELLDTIDISYIEAESLLAGHEADTPDPWIFGADQTGTHPWQLSSPGVEALATALDSVLPIPLQLPPAPTDHPVIEASIVLDTTPDMAPNVEALISAIPDWFAGLSEDSEASITIHRLGTEGDNTPFSNLASVDEVTDALTSIALTGSSPTSSAVSDTIEEILAEPVDDLIQRPIVVWLTTLVPDQNELPDPLFETLQRHMDAKIDFLASDLDLFRLLSDHVIDTNASVTPLPILANLGQVLPLAETAPTGVPLTIELADTKNAVIGQPIVLEVATSSVHATDGTVAWSLGEEIIAEGQRTTLPAGLLSIGTHDVSVTVTGPTTTQSKSIAITVTADGDASLDGDVCPDVFDPTQIDSDGDGLGNACDQDDDNDDIPDVVDPCTTTANIRLTDDDLDRIPNTCDSDPANGPGADWDEDDVPDVVDNCPSEPNATQSDIDDDGTGDLCDSDSRVICTIFGTAQPDRLVGTARPDVICGFGGDDILIGLNGNDTLIGGAGDDTLHGGDGDDLLLGGSGDDLLLGGEGSDRHIGESGDDVLRGDGGNDILFGSSGVDRLFGHVGDDLLIGGTFDDYLNGGEGDDVLSGDTGSDTVIGRSGNDTIATGNGSDTVRAGSGADIIIDSRTRDTVNSGPGIDVIGGAAITID